MTSLKAWTENLVQQCQESFKRLLPLTARETEFLNYLLDKGDVQPQLITSDGALIANIQQHTAIKWSMQDKKEKG